MDKMPTSFFLCLGLVLGFTSAQSAVSSCQDLDANGCKIFQMAKPDLCNDPNFAMSTCKRFCGNCPLECYNCPQAVFDPDDCNVTTTCGPNMTCMTKHLRAKDGHHEYILTCERKEICSGLNFGFGKRAAEDFGDSAYDEEGRYERNIIIDCCDTDFCNYPVQTTTTSLPPPTTVAAGACLRDIVFVIDDSGSVGSTNFKHSLEFVNQIVSQINIGQNSAHVAVMAFSAHPQIEWYLNTYTTKTQLQNALQHNIRYVSGITNTGEALTAVKNKILSFNHGDRPTVENAVVVLTDGKSNNRAGTAAAASALHGVSRDVIAIGVGRGVDTTELNLIATDRRHVFGIQGYPYLPQLVSQIRSLICS